MESKMKHTPEPWHTGGNGTIIYDKDGWGIASATVYHCRQESGEAESNARRIVSCVNACRHYTTYDLEDVGENLSGVYADVKARCAELIAQRDELLAALKHLVYEEGNRYFVGWRDDTDVTEYVSEAIAKCEVQS